MKEHLAFQPRRRDDRISYPFTLPITPIDWTWDQRMDGRQGARDGAAARGRNGREILSRKRLTH